jgi:predicted amidohydrolase
MATDLAGFVQFSDGSFASLLAEGATAETITSMPTGGTGLNQVANVQIGQAYEGKTAIAASVRVITDDAVTGAFCHAYFQGPDGKIICPVEGGGFQATGVDQNCYVKQRRFYNRTSPGW